MAVYTYSECEIASIIRASKRIRLAYCAVAVKMLSAAVVVAFTRPEWIFGAQQRARFWVIAALFVFFAGPLADTAWNWKRRRRSMEDSLRRTIIEVTEKKITLSNGLAVKQLSSDEIQVAEEVPWGLYLRSEHRYRWILIPARIENFNAFRRELSAMQIPIQKAMAPPNWEEFLGVIVFTATMVCAIFSRSAGVLIANLAVSLLVAIAGFLIVSANPDNLPKMRWARFSIFLPVAMSASMLWIALQG